MALFTPSESPAVVVKEIDLTGGVPNVQSTTGAIVGNFRWGPVEERTKIANETELVDTFASPDSSNTIDFHNASYFLRYSSSMQVVRAIDGSAANAFSTTRATDTTGQEVLDSDQWSGGVGGSLTQGSNGNRSEQARLNHLAQVVVVKNENDFNAQLSALSDLTKSPVLSSDSDGAGNLLVDSDASNALDPGNHTWIARYPGALGNSLEVSICPANATAFAAWDYENDFDAAPTTSQTTEANVGLASNDEVHIVIADKNGKITGTKGTVLETYPFLSVVKGSTRDGGVTNYALDVINQNSKYVWMANWDSDWRALGAGNYLADSDNSTFSKDNTAATTYVFDKGVNSGSLGMSEFATGHDLFEDKDQVEVDFLIAPGLSGDAWTTTTGDLISTAESRKDCVVVSSPPRDKVINRTSTSDIVTDTVAAANGLSKRSSYHFMDNNYLKVYDKYNDQYIQIPAASSTAGLMAATDLNRAPWFSPAGARRGGYLGITSIAYSPTKGQRDTLYKASVNPVANIPGQGTLLFGDKTMLTRSSAFDRINVRRLFLILERAIARAAEQVLFEFNDEFTRAEFVNIIEPVLREIKGRRGITDFRVVADETNNTPEVIDRNEFIANIFIKPARSINYVTLNFVAVRTGVDFEEVVGTV